VTGRRSRKKLLAARVAGMVCAAVLVACAPAPSQMPGASSLPTPIVASRPSPVPTVWSAPTGAPQGLVILVGEVVTMDGSGRAEAIAYEDGSVVAVGARDDVLALADDSTVVVQLGDNVAYPGFIDAHAHWIGDRDYMGIDSPGEAMAAAVSRGWTSISEEWVDPGRLEELETLAAGDELGLRVDAYLALNLPAPSGEHLGDWYSALEPGARSERLTVKGVKVTLDNGWGTQFWWEPEELAATVGRADEAGWQVAVHTVSTEAHEMVLAAFEGALDGSPNALHHRIDHAVQVTDAQLERMVAADLVTVVHLDGAASDWVLEADYLGNLDEDRAWLARWRDFVDAGLHVASATDAPWIFPDLALTDDIGRPVDQVAGAMDGRGRANPNTPAWVLEQLLTAEQALKTITVDAAYALGDEARRGHLAPGTYADITILSGDVTSGTPDEIRELDVIATIIGGTSEYCAAAAICPGG
jgi:predicted amidohydrolase YtcJ